MSPALTHDLLPSPAHSRGADEDGKPEAGTDSETAGPSGSHSERGGAAAEEEAAAPAPPEGGEAAAAAAAEAEAAEQVAEAAREAEAAADAAAAAAEAEAVQALSAKDQAALSHARRHLQELQKQLRDVALSCVLDSAPPKGVANTVREGCFCCYCCYPRSIRLVPPPRLLLPRSRLGSIIMQERDTIWNAIT